MNECVLVVDDDREIVKVIAILLEKEGYQVCRAYDGLQALDVLMSREVHLILMDIMMPKLDGLSALMKIREQKNLPVIVLSAKGEETDKILGLSMERTTISPSPICLRNWWRGSEVICAGI